MIKRIEGAWTGWSGNTIVKLTDGSVWEQTEYFYLYRYACRLAAAVTNNKMLVGCARRSG